VNVIKNADKEYAVHLGFQGPGRMIGEVSLIKGSARTASLQAAEPTNVWIIPRSVFWDAVDQDVEFRRTVMDNLVGHLMVADQSRIDAAATERALYQAIHLREQTTGFIVHDLRNPLSAVMLAMELIRMEPGFDANSPIAEDIDLAVTSLRRMKSMVESLLDVEKLKADTDALTMTQFDIQELVGEVIARNQSLAEKNHVMLLAQQGGTYIPPITADRVRIDRVVTNLLDNALKFTPSGGTIAANAFRVGPWVEVSVSDTGPGIPDEERWKVFEFFTQTSSSRRAGKGFGLGLTYCRSAVEAHKGSIWVEDGPGGKGTRFVFHLPLEGQP
jgi:signal transduction histidine kinase